MKIVYPATNRPEYYDRSLSPQYVYWATGSIAPHANTERAFYTDPAGWLTHVSSIGVYIRRLTAAAPVGLYQIQIVLLRNAVSYNLLTVATKDNTVDFILQNVYPADFWLAPTDKISIYSFDGSTGGTVAYTVSVPCYAFNA